MPRRSKKDVAEAAAREPAAAAPDAVPGPVPTTVTLPPVDAVVATTTTSRRASKKPAGLPAPAAPAPGAVATTAATATAPPSRPTRHASRLPAPIQFPLVVVLSFAISSLGYSILDGWSGGGLAGASSRSLDAWSDVALLAGWRILELATGWFGSYDSIDLASLNVLTHGPSLFLLAAFYDVSPAIALSALAIDVLSALVPFQLLRPLSGAHAGAPSVPNRELVADVPIQVYTTLLAAAVYGVTVVSALRLLLPRFLVLYFDGIPTVRPAYEASYSSPQVIVAALLLGLATRSFVFTPFTAAADTAPEDETLAEFDPAAATLGETFWYNAWGYKARTKVAILRTAAVVAGAGVSTFLQCALTVSGVASTGAAAYAAVWAVAGLLTGLALGVVGGA